MTKEQLTERIQKTEEKIAKIEKRISKWTSGMNSEAKSIVARCELVDNDVNLKSVTKIFRDYLYTHQRDNTVSNHEDYNKGPQFDEAYRAYRDLANTKNTLAKYINLLNIEMIRDDTFNNKIEVIWNFLMQYKDKVSDYIRNNMNTLNEYYKANSLYCDLINNKYHLINNVMTEEEFKQKAQHLKEKEEQLTSAIHPITRLVAKRDIDGTKIVDEDKLNEILMEDCKNRYLDLVNEVTRYTGVISDATNLEMRAGELNGIIIGEKGKAKIQTFSAGGHSTHTIVNEKHGQCFHYRTRVTSVK